MKEKIRYSNPYTIKEAIDIQNDLAKKLLLKPLTKAPNNLLALDCSYDLYNGFTFAVGVLWDIQKGKAIDIIKEKVRTTFRYITGLLSFREIPALIEVLKHIDNIELLLVDGQGILHPRGFGIASHLGVIYNIPSIGIAKSRLVGKITYTGNKRKGIIGEISFHGNNKAGILFSNGYKPLFISPGHLIDINSIITLLPNLFKNHRLPEPLFLADKYSKTVKNEI